MTHEDVMELQDLASRLRALDCEHPDITILGHDLARRIEGHLNNEPLATRRPIKSAMPRFFLATVL
ncbi:hypothetical protein [Rhodospirillum sp. A1_3_36]|uniref:hypothetical protein n=1 Tax=Rhodospirillum sp. A1_3_36 TaxID=3391666 RepID=UPI0039A6D6E3